MLHGQSSQAHIGVGQDKYTLWTLSQYSENYRSRALGSHASQTTKGASSRKIRRCHMAYDERLPAAAVEEQIVGEI